MTLSIFIQVEQATSSLVAADQIAENNALLGLQVALGELQKTVGPDQRITATAEIFGDPVDGAKHWTGVWTGGRTRDWSGKPDPISWLISGNAGLVADDAEFVSPLDTLADPTNGANTPSVWMINFKDNDGDSIQNSQVKAPVVQVSNSSGAYAYWVGDEGVKAHIGSELNEVGTTILDQYYAQKTGGDFNLDGIPESDADESILANISDFIDASQDDYDRLSSLLDLNFLPGNLSEIEILEQEARRYFHAMSPYSRGVLANVQDGGLRKDLSLALEMERNLFNQSPTFANSGFWNVDNNGNRLGDYELGFLFEEEIPDHPQGSDRVAVGPTWQRLRDHYRLYHSLNGNGGFMYSRHAYPGQDSGNAKLGAFEVNQASPGPGQIDNYTWMSPARDRNRPETANLNPIMLRYVADYRLKVENRIVNQYEPPNFATSTQTNKDVLTLVINVSVVLMNPYNVPIRFKAANMTFDFKNKEDFVLGILVTDNPANVDPDNRGNYIEVSMVDIGFANNWWTDPGGNQTNRINYANARSFFKVAVTREPGTDYIEMAPGEIMIFAPDSLTSSNSSLPILAGYSSIGGITASVPTDAPTVEMPYDFIVIEDTDQIYTFFESLKLGKQIEPRLRVNSAGVNQDDVERGYNTKNGQAMHVMFQIDEAEAVRFEDSQTGPDPKAALTGADYPRLWSFVYEHKTFDPTNGAFPIFALANPLAPMARKEYNFTNSYGGNYFWTGFTVGSNESIENVINIDPSDDSVAWWGESFNRATGSSQVASREIPLGPMTSLAGFQHVEVSPLSSHPIYAIGNSLAHPFLRPDQVYSTNTITEISTVFHDASYLSNEALWDSYYFSTLVSEANSSISDAIQGFAADGESLPNRFFELSEDVDETTMEAAILDTSTQAGNSQIASDAYLKSAALLEQEGAFNINSTSVEAWRAFLGSNDKVTTLIRNTLGNTVVDKSSASHVFSRFDVSPKSSDDIWAGYRELDDEMIRDLAQALVDEIKLRGPFLSLSDFVNRRLSNDSAYAEIAKKGALQAAIDKTGNVNASVSIAHSDDSAANFNYMPYPELIVQETGTGVPGFLLQSDLLNVLGPYISARSDTFIIRAYGDARNRLTGVIESRKWCEAVVQRRIEFVDDSNPAYTPVDDDEASAYGLAPLAELNKQFGREFEVIHFRWITPETL